MNQLIDFLNHGILPFVGRSDELRRLMEFWRGTMDAQELRGLLLSGEAGIGKSRLLDELMSQISESGGMVIHVKIYPASTTSIIPLVAQSLWYCDHARLLLKKEPQGTLSDVVGGLHRLAGLRPTLLVVEDIHLLEGEALGEFSMFADALADVPLALLSVARTVELRARGLLERFMVTEIELGGFRESHMLVFWERLFGTTPPDELPRILCDATGGSPLVLRSAIRSAIASGAIVCDPFTDRWDLGVPPETFGGMLKHQARILAEGMALHLNDEEREAARHLAALGEIFARETGAVMAGIDDQMLSRLMFKGIIATSTIAMPEPLGPASTSPLLTFTHTLLHQHFIASAHPPLDALAGILASELPLYSSLPFQIVARQEQPPDVSAALLRRLIERALMVSRRLDTGSDWEMAATVWQSAHSIFSMARDRWAGQESLELEVSILIRRLSILRRHLHDEEFGTLVHRVVELTRDAASGQMLEQRLRAFRYLHLHYSHYQPDQCTAVWDAVEELIGRHPRLRFTRPYIIYLRDVAQAASRIPDERMLRTVEQHMEALNALEDLPDDMRELAGEELTQYVLNLFHTPEELEKRLQQFRTLGPGRARHSLHALTLLESTGFMEEALRMAEESAEIFRKRGLRRNLFHCSLVRLCALASFGMPLERIASAARALLHGVREPVLSSHRRNIGIYLSEVGLLRGEPAWTAAIIEEFAPAERTYWAEAELLLSPTVAALPDIARSFPEQGRSALLKPMLCHAAGLPGADPAIALMTLRELLRRPLLRMDDLLPLHAVMALCSIPGPGVTIPVRELRDDIQQALVLALEWLLERSLSAYMIPLLGHCEGYLTKRALAEWRQKARSIEKDRRGLITDRGDDDRLRIFMAGTIAIQKGDGIIEPLRGGRLRTMLGLLVAAEMVKQPLSHREFCQLAAGGELDPDLARKTANMAAIRLRELVGGDAIITGEETYRLDLRRVQVDLLDADTSLREATLALRRRGLKRAQPALLRALELIDGKVPFAGLYDTFFETLRDDFDQKLRAAVMDIARALLRESDAAGAAEILRRRFDAIQDDEEIAGLYQEALTILGQKAQAVRIRMRAEESLGA